MCIRDRVGTAAMSTSPEEILPTISVGALARLKVYLFAASPASLCSISRTMPMPVGPFSPATLMSTDW